MKRNHSQTRLCWSFQIARTKKEVHKDRDKLYSSSMEEDKTTTMDTTTNTGLFILSIVSSDFLVFSPSQHHQYRWVLLVSFFFFVVDVDVVDAVADPPADGTAGLYGSK